MVGNYDLISKDRKLTKTALFIMPLLFKDYTVDQVFGMSIFNSNINESFLVNAFLQDINKIYEQDKIYLLVDADKVKGKLDKHYFALINKSKLYKGMDTIFYDKWYDIFTFERPIEHMGDIVRLINGNYNDIGLATKEAINKFWKNNMQIKSILNKTIYGPNASATSLKLQENGEVFPPFNMMDETLPEEQEFEFKILAA